MSSTLQEACAWRVSAAAPVTCGAAIEVPDRNSNPVPEPTRVDAMLTPGAVISGFNALSPLRGPPDVKDAKALNVGFAIVAGETAAVAPAAAVSVALAVRLTPRNGMVTVNGTPSSGLNVIGPSNGGRPATLFTITTAAAPACCPKMAFATRAQTPRCTTTIVFGGSGPPKSATVQPSTLAPVSTFTV